MKPCLLGFATLLAFGLTAGCNPKADPQKKAGAQNGAINPTSSPTPAPVLGEPDPANLAAYLLSHPAAEVLRVPLVLPFVPAPFPKDPGAVAPAGTEAFRSFVEGFLNRAMALPALTPGRKFSVFISNDQGVNAYADGWQQITILQGAVNSLDPLGMLATLCHESAHSSRNHEAADAPAQDQITNSPAFVAIGHDIDNYFSSAYSNGIYTHNLAAYSSLHARFLTTVTALGNLIMLAESQADVVGGMTCAHMGFAPLDYMNSLERVLTTAAGHSNDGPETIKNGERFQISSADADDFLTNYLFSIPNHPSNDERAAQIKRLADIIQKELDSSQTLLSEWKQTASSYLKAQTVALAANDNPSLVVIQREGGAAPIVIDKSSRDVTIKIHH